MKNLKYITTTHIFLFVFVSCAVRLVGWDLSSLTRD